MNLMARKFWGSIEEMRGKPVDVLIPDPNVDPFRGHQGCRHHR